jgi:hypothetical protein
MMLPFSSMWLTAVFSAPVLIWLFLFVVVLWTFTLVELYRLRRIISDLRKQNDLLNAQRKNAETVKEELEASMEMLAANRDRLEASEEVLAANKKRLEASNKALQAEKNHLEQKIVELTSSGPQIYGVWSNSQTFWQMSWKGKERVMQIGARIHLSSRNTDEVLHLLAAYIEGQRLDLSEPVSVRPDLIEDEHVVLYISPPLESDVTRSYTPTIMLEDHQNRLHALPRHTFRPTEQTPP